MSTPRYESAFLFDVDNTLLDNDCVIAGLQRTLSAVGTARLDGWKAEVDKPKAKASGASADAQQALNEQIEALESRIEEGTIKLAG